jgi:hypothetical protein
MTGGALPAHRRGGEQAASTKLDTRAHIGNVSVTHFNWTPGIGDPTIGGWVTVALYLLASGSCWISAQKLGLADIPRSNERRAWRAISVLFLALGINKQLNLLSALTEAGRVLAQDQGWYEQRQFVQLVFIALAAMTCLIAAITLLLWARNFPIPTRITLIGTMMVLGFVLIRAVSLHHVDWLIRQRILGLRWHWILEMSGISLVLFASQWRQVGAKSMSRSVHVSQRKLT